MENPYQSPEKYRMRVSAAPHELECTVFGGGVDLATKGERLLGHIVDYAAIWAPPLGLSLLVGDFPFSYTLSGGVRLSSGGILQLMLAVPTLLLQAILISLRGQSLGKLIIKTRIVDFETGAKVGFARAVLVREWLFWVPSLVSYQILDSVPRGGGLSSWIVILAALVGLVVIADHVCIFLTKNRCLHDLVAATRVVKT